MAEVNFQCRPEGETLRLFLVRHGETDANLKRYLQGMINGPLNATGREQAERLGRHLQSVSLDRVWSSDMQRAIDTAAAVAGPHGLTVDIDPRLREWDVGDLDGQPAAIYLQMIKATGKPLSQFVPPGGQTLPEVRQRADAVIRQLVDAHLGETILMCSHGDFMRMLTGSILQIDSDAAMAFYFDNASYSVFEFIEGHWKVLALNRIAASDG